jgi:hypothetical protein
MNAHGSGVTRLTTNLGHDNFPAWARPFSPVLAVVLGALVYGGLLLLLGTFDEEDRALLRRLLGRGTVASV